jgi:Bax protein
MLNKLTKNLSSRKALLLVGGILIGGSILFTLIKILSPSGSPVVIADISTPDSIVIHTDSLVKPILYSKVPDLSELSVKERKKRFIHLMLPAILLAQEKMLEERLQIERIIGRKNEGGLSGEDSTILNGYIEKFKAKSGQDLLDRLNLHPSSIILAQSAIESGWGSSRFFREANNVFGIWSYNSNEKRIVAGESRGGNNIYLRSYDTLFDSVYDYLVVIARGNAYKDFRKTRIKSEDPYRLIWFLRNYSEKRLGYVVALRNMIEFNNFIQYDQYQLEEIDKNDESWKKLLAS